MEWFYAAEGGKRGPVSDGQLEELLRAGSISPATLVWHADLLTWQPLREVWSSPVVNARCAECHREFAEDETLRFEGLRVCAHCKPVLLQRIAEGGALPWPADSLLRDGHQLVLRAGAPLPDSCILCNAPANGYRISQRFHRKGAGPRKIVLELPLCAHHRRHRCWFIRRGSVLAFIAIAIFLVADGLRSEVSIIALCAGVLFGTFVTHWAVVEHVKTQDDFMWLKGVSPAWLEGLPEWRDPAK